MFLLWVSGRLPCRLSASFCVFGSLTLSLRTPRGCVDLVRIYACTLPLLCGAEKRYIRAVQCYFSSATSCQLRDPRDELCPRRSS